MVMQYFKNKLQLARFLLLFTLALCRYELQEKGQLNIEDIGLVPDVYTNNQVLDQELKQTRSDLEKFRNAAMCVA